MKFDVNEENYEALYGSWGDVILRPTKIFMKDKTNPNMVMESVEIGGEEYCFIPADLCVANLTSLDVCIYIKFCGYKYGQNPLDDGILMVNDDQLREWDETVAIHNSLLALIELGYLERVEIETVRDEDGF